MMFVRNVELVNVKKQRMLCASERERERELLKVDECKKFDGRMVHEPRKNLFHFGTGPHRPLFLEDLYLPFIGGHIRNL